MRLPRRPRRVTGLAANAGPGVAAVVFGEVDGDGPEPRAEFRGLAVGPVVCGSYGFTEAPLCDGRCLGAFALHGASGALGGGDDFEAAVLEGGEADWKYEITPYVPGECHPVVFFDMAISGDPVGRIEMTLRDDVCPETCENFRCLCTGERGDLVRGSSRQHLWYKGCRFHRVIPDFMAQGGDITRNNGSGGHSIYGKKFADENFELKFDKAGALAMANGGKNTNSSQFFIALQPCEWLDGKHTVFGFVSAGMDVVRMIEDCGTAQGRTRGIVTIAQCGQLQ